MFLKKRFLVSLLSTNATALFIAALSAFPAPAHAAGDAGNWTFRNPLPTINGLNGVTFAQGQFIAVGDHLTILTSANGTAWNPSLFSYPDGLTDANLEAVAGNSTLLVAVGDTNDSNYGTILTSPDGKIWTAQNSTVQEDLYSVATNGALFVAVGQTDDFGTIVTSTNGVTWTAQNSTVEQYLYAVATNGAAFVAVGSGDAFATIVTSLNGSIWLAQNSTLANRELYAVAANSTLFVAVGESGSIVTSPTGVIWTVRTSTNTQDFSSVVWTGTQFVASSNAAQYYTSPDGVTWTAHDSADENDNIYALASNSTLNVAVGYNSNANVRAAVETSPDGVAWTAYASDLTDDTTINGIGVSGKTFVAVDSDGLAYASPDGTTWTQYPTPTDSLAAVAGNGTVFVAVGETGVVETSANGTVWTEYDSDTNYFLYGVAWNGTLFAAVGEQGAIVTSPDSTTWTSQSSPTSSDLAAITSNGTLWVAVGDDDEFATILTSPDGINWATQNSTVEDNFTAAAWNGSVFAVAGQYEIVTSPDGVTWTAQENPTSGIQGIASDGAQFVLVNDAGQIFSSPDGGVTWNQQPTHLSTRSKLYSVAWNGVNFVAVGRYGIVLSTGSAVVVKPSITTQPVNQVGGAGKKATFSVIASGPGPITYQWQKNGQDISGATSSSLTLSNLKTTNTGSYTVIVTNAGGSVTSKAANLKIVQKLVALYILVPPKPIADSVGAKVTLSVVVNAPATKPITYQWFKAGVAVKNSAGQINGAKTDTLIFKNLSKSDSGTYSVTITNPAGSIKSTTVRVTVR